MEASCWGGAAGFWWPLRSPNAPSFLLLCRVIPINHNPATRQVLPLQSSVRIGWGSCVKAVSSGFSPAMVAPAALVLAALAALQYLHKLNSELSLLGLGCCSVTGLNPFTSSFSCSNHNYVWTWAFFSLGYPPYPACPAAGGIWSGTGVCLENISAVTLFCVLTEP